MREKKVTRYYCDWCKTSKGTRPSMALHEKHCTMNPARSCRLCESAMDLSTVIPLVLAIPEATDGAYQELPDSIRDACGHCPACILAALRQSKSPNMFSFDYQAEARVFLDEKNSQRDDDWRQYNGEINRTLREGFY